MNPLQPYSDIIITYPNSSCVMFNFFHCVDYSHRTRYSVTTRNYGKSTQEYYRENTTYDGCEMYV